MLHSRQFRQLDWHPNRRSTRQHLWRRILGTDRLHWLQLWHQSRLIHHRKNYGSRFDIEEDILSVDLAKILLTYKTYQEDDSTSAGSRSNDAVLVEWLRGSVWTCQISSRDSISSLVIDLGQIEVNDILLGF